MRSKESGWFMTDTCLSKSEWVTSLLCILAKEVKKLLPPSNIYYLNYGSNFLTSFANIHNNEVTHSDLDRQVSVINQPDSFDIKHKVGDFIVMYISKGGSGVQKY